MKTTIHHKIIPAGLSLLAALPALAIEPPKDDAPPPPSVKTPTSAPADTRTGSYKDEAPAQNPPTGGTARQRIVPSPEEQSPTAFIGIISDDIPESLSAHIGVKAGEGVMIRDLAPGGPAEKAGFAKYDVITHVAGKTVGSPADLSREIASGKPGDEVPIDFIHQGAKSSKTVKLDTRPESSGRPMNPRQLGHLDLDDMPDDQADRIRDIIDKQLRGMMRDSRDLENFGLRREPDRFRENAQERGGGLRSFQFKQDSTFRLMDNDGSVEIRSKDGSKEITVRDHEGKETWSGPWNTEEEKAAAPKDVRQRIDKFNIDDSFKGGGFRFRMGGQRDEE